MADVTITINDGAGASVIVPASTVQTVIGCSTGGTAPVATPTATRSLATLTSLFGTGPLVEYAAMAILAGGTVIAMKATTAVAGSATAVTATAGNTGTAVLTVTGTPNDSYLVKILVVVGGTVGATNTATFQFSLDAGRTYSPVLAVPQSAAPNLYAIPGTGITLSFAAGSMVAADSFTFSTIQPAWNAAGVQACLTALGASAFAATGWGSTHIVGTAAGADATSIQGYFDTLATGQIYGDVFLSSRDLARPVVWGGAGETEAAWTTAIQTDYSATSCKRVGSTAGYYNVNSAFPIVGTVFRYRRPLSWSYAARTVAIQPQTHAGRVSDGSLTQIIVDPTNDPQDGFVYHDERNNPGLTTSRFICAKTRVKMGGYFVDQPNMLSPIGSVFSIRPLRAVMDIACTITTAQATLLLNSDVRLTAGGTIFDAEAKTIETKITQAINDAMTSNGMLSQAGPNNSGVVVTVDRTNNVKTTKNVNITVTIYARGYILTETIGIGFG